MITAGGKGGRDRTKTSEYHGFSCHAIIYCYDDLLVRRGVYGGEQLA